MPNNYTDQQEKMLRQLCEDFSTENFSDYLEAAGRAMAAAFSIIIKDPVEIEVGLAHLFEAVRGQALGGAKRINKSIDAAEFLETHYNPEKLDG